MTVSVRRTPWLSGVMGVLAFSAAQVPLLLLTPPVDGISAPGWFLNSGRNVLVVVAVLFAGAAVVRARKQASDRDAGFYFVGAEAAMLVTLFFIGPGNLFPIVIVLSSTMVGFVVFAGASCGANLRAWRTHAG